MLGIHKDYISKIPKIVIRSVAIFRHGLTGRRSGPRVGSALQFRFSPVRRERRVIRGEKRLDSVRIERNAPCHNWGESIKVIYNKLVRDRIPEIIENAGKSCRVRTLDTEEFVVRLREKLDEEIAEYRRAEASAEAIEELADILEVIYHLAEVHGATVEELEAVRIRKRDKRGGFGQRLFLIEADE